MKFTKAILTLAAGATLVLAFVTTASAHARYKDSTPAKGEIVSTPPTKLDLFFTQSIQKVSGTYDLTVEKDRGPIVSIEPAVIDESDRSHVTVALQPNLTPGRYVVNWKNVSDDDGDPATGAFSFYVRTQPNTVDLANDQQLESIGAEENTPDASTTAAASSTATGPPTASVTRPSASPTVVPPATGTGSGGSNRGLYLAIGAIAAVVAAVGGAFVVARSRRMRP